MEELLASQVGTNTEKYINPCLYQDSNPRSQRSWGPIWHASWPSGHSDWQPFIFSEMEHSARNTG